MPFVPITIRIVMELPLQTLVQELDSWIRHGQSDKAREELAKLDVKHLPRAYAASIAWVARRADYPAMAISILHPFVRPNVSNQISASVRELAEYAAALTYMGASREALQLLRPLNTAAVPEALLYMSYAYFAEWDYETPIELLKTYLAIPNIGEYWKLVARINLAAAMVHEEKTDQVESILDELLETTHKREYSFHRAKTLELFAENNLQKGDWDNAQRFLFEANAMVRRGSPLQKLFLHKWRAILALKKLGPAKEVLKKLNEVSTEARTLEHWETLRDCHQQEAIVTKNTALLWQLYFGTPYSTFRDKLLIKFEGNLKVPDFFLWKLGEGDSTGTKIQEIDLSQLTGNKQDSKSRLLAALASDFYGDFRLPKIAFHLDRGAPFHPENSNEIVVQTLKEFEFWMKQENLPLIVTESQGSYRLSSTKPIVIKVQLELLAKDAWYLDSKRAA